MGKLQEIIDKTLKLDPTVRGSAIWIYEHIVDELTGMNSPVHIKYKIESFEPKKLIYKSRRLEMIKSLKEKQREIDHQMKLIENKKDDEVNSKKQFEAEVKRQLDAHAQEIESIIAYSEQMITEFNEISNNMMNQKKIEERFKEEKRALEKYYSDREVEIKNTMNVVKKQTTEVGIMTDEKTSDTKEGNIAIMEDKLMRANNKNAAAKEYLSSLRDKMVLMKKKNSNMMLAVKTIIENSSDCPPVIKTMMFIKKMGEEPDLIDEPTMLRKAIMMIN